MLKMGFSSSIIQEAYSLFQNTNKIPLKTNTDNLRLGKTADQKIGKMNKPQKSESFPVRVLWKVAFRMKSFRINSIRLKMKRGDKKLFRRSYILNFSLLYVKRNFGNIISNVKSAKK